MHPYLEISPVDVPLIVLIALLSYTCDEPPPSGPPLTVVDSAGTEIVEFDLDQVPTLGPVDPNPNWIFGEGPDSEGSVPLNHVVDARLLSDGRVVIANFQPQEILVADPVTGKWTQIADDGSGPGGLDFISSIFIVGNLIGVHEGVRREWLTYSDSAYLRGQRLPPVGVAGPYFPDVAISDGDGFYIGDAYAPPGSPGGVVIRRELLVARVEKGQVDTIAIVPGETGIDKFTGVSPQPFGPTFGMAAADSGIWLGDSAIPEVRFWTRNGQLSRIVRWRSAEDRALTRQKLNTLRDRYIEGRPPEIQARIRRNFRETSFPDEIPAWGTLIVESDGVLWVGEYPGPDADSPMRPPYPAQRWWGIDSQGRPVGTLVSPPGLKVTDFAGDYLIGIHRDSLGIETVRRHEILNFRDAAVGP